MRILHVTDFHFRRPWFDWLAAQSKEFDVCCFTGDLLNMFPQERVTIRQQMQWVLAWLDAFPGRLFVCSGNHDSWPKTGNVSDGEAEGAWLKKANAAAVSVDGTNQVIENYRFICCPWRTMPDYRVSEPAVVLIHSPPYGTPLSLDLGCEVGDADVTAAAYGLPRGSFILSGHVHDPRRWYVQLRHTWCFNPGVDAEATVPNHVVIDTGTQRANFHGWGRDYSPIDLKHAPTAPLPAC
jgi:uncharacterized protein